MGQRWIRVEPLGMVQPITHNLVETETRYHVVWFSQSLWFSVSEDIILYTIRPCIWGTNASKYKPIQICQPVQLADKVFFIYFLLMLWRGGEQIFVKCFLQKGSDWMPHTGLKCLNANFIYYATHRPGGHFLFIQNLFFWRSTLTNYCKHFPKNICREFISPVGYFYPSAP